MADLSALLEREASAEIESILSEARERASEIVAEAEREAETLRAARERSAASQKEAMRVRSRSSAQLDASSMRLRAQQEAIRDVFDTAERTLRDLVEDRDRYAEVFGKLLDEALAGLDGSSPDAVEVNPADEELAREALQRAGVEAEVRHDPELEGGVRVRTGRITLENTLTGRLAALREELASEVAHLLTRQEA